MKDELRSERYFYHGDCKSYHAPTPPCYTDRKSECKVQQLERHLTLENSTKFGKPFGNIVKNEDFALLSIKNGYVRVLRW